jgi:hypothetical protein
LRIWVVVVWQNVLKDPVAGCMNVSRSVATTQEKRPMSLTTDPLERWPSFQPLPVPPVPTDPDPYELTEEQAAEVERFVRASIAAMLSTTPPSDAQAEAYLGQAYGVVGLDPPAVRWFDSPIAFALAPDLPLQSLELVLRTSVEARVAAMCAEGVSESLWDALSIRLLDPISDGVWSTVGRLIEQAAFAHIGQSNGASTHREADLWEIAGTSFWDTAKRSLPMPYMERRIRVGESVQAYRSAVRFAQATCFAHILGPHELLPVARFNELVSGYRLGRHDAWLVRRPISLACDECGCLHAEGSMCLRYRDGWGVYAWHGRRVSEQFILRPETLTLEDWLRERDTADRERIQERIGHRRFSEMVGGLRIDNERLMVDLGQGQDLEPTGYAFYRRGDPGEPPRVCRLPWVFSQSQCANGCPHFASCPDATELFIRPKEPAEETP